MEFEAWDSKGQSFCYLAGKCFHCLSNNAQWFCILGFNLFYGIEVNDWCITS